MSKRRELQEINAGSMADIAFQLLIFFQCAMSLRTLLVQLLLHRDQLAGEVLYLLV